MVRALPQRDLDPEERAALTSAVQARTGIAATALGELLMLALSPAFRAAVTEEELSAFEARFGPAYAEALRDEERGSLALSEYARRYGSEEALLFLDTLFAICGSDGSIDKDELARINRVARELGVDTTLVAALLQKHDPLHAAGDLRFPLKGSRVVIGRAPGCDVVLPDPLVAMRHAELLKVGDGWRIVDLRSGRPTVVGNAAVASAPITADSQIRVGPYTLRLAGNELRASGARSFSALSVRHVSRRIKHKLGQQVLLDDVSFTVFSGEVVAVVGPSGAGKTTLLNAIAGVTLPDQGEVLLDGQPFHDLLAADPLLLGVVPQEDLVHADLTVEESLRYAARLRLSKDTSNAEIDQEVGRVLGELDIARVREARIGDQLRRGISGGERRRVNLGQELVARSTRVLFLDEPTSGLDPRATLDIIRLIRQLADRGRIVFLVTHDLTPQVMAQADHLLVLTPGGRVAWFGPPAEACTFFGVPTPDAIFDRLGDKAPEAWRKSWQDSVEARKYVATREHLLGVGRRPRQTEATVRQTRPSVAHQLRTLTARYAIVKARDATGLLVLGLQPFLIAAVMWIVFPGATTSFVFTLALTALWFGMSAAVRELITDRAIWRRERRVGLSVRAYLSSKVIVLASIAAIQCALLAGLAFVAMGLSDYGFSMTGLAGASILTGWVGMALGLLVSASWRSSEAAVGTLPLLIIPQISFATLLVSLRDMGALAKALSAITLQRYAFELSVKSGETLATASRVPGEWNKTPITGPLYEMGLKPAGSEDMGLSVAALCGILGGFGLLFLSVASVIVWQRDRRKGT